MTTAIHTSARGRRRRIVASLGALAALGGTAALAALPAGEAVGAAPTVPEEGLVCTTHRTGAHSSAFVLEARRGQIATADGNSVPMWGFTADNGGYQYPSPFLCVNEGDAVTVILRNRLGNGKATSIVFPGQAHVLADGAPSTPSLNVDGSLASFTKPAPDGQAVTYTFTASRAGTFLYESGTDPGIQVQMGLFGGLIVKSTVAPATGDAFKDAHGAYGYDDGNGNGSPRSLYNKDKEFVQLLSDVDPDLHGAIDANQPYDIGSLTPRYWFINGRSFPDDIAPNGAEWLPAQPYSAFVHIEPVDTNSASPNYNPLPALIRYINVSNNDHPFHPHANDSHVIAVDGALLQSAGGGDMAFDQYSIDVNPGGTADATYDWSYIWKYSKANPIPVPMPDFRDTRYTGGATWFGGSPALGETDSLPVGVTSYNKCGEYYHVAHSHDVHEATTYGAAMGGMLTLYRIDPPGGCK